MKKIILTLVLFSLTNFIAWNFFGLSLIVSIACIFFIIFKLNKINLFKSTIILFITAFLLNLSSTFWLLEVTWWESLLAFTGNSIVMTIPLFLTCLYFKKYKRICIPFTIFWIVFEFLHSKWDLSWPWLTFGNVMGNQHELIQWYSILGVYSGSMWLIILGFLLFLILRNLKNYKYYFFFFLTLIIPISSSIYSYKIKSVDTSNPLRITTYINKATETSTNYKISKDLFFKFNNKSVTNYLICPEIFFTKTHIKNLRNGVESIFLNKFINKHKKASIILGAEILNNKGELFNSVILIKKKNYQIRTKKKYIPVREYTPPILSVFFGKSFYKKNNNDNTYQILSITKIFPIICYESIFSNFIAKNSIQSEVIFLLTSEKFMNNSHFAKLQYLNIIRLRAIENNKNILKCSTAGYSCIINEKGDITKKIENEIENNTIYKIKRPSIYQKLNSML